MPRRLRRSRFQRRSRPRLQAPPRVADRPGLRRRSAMGRPGCFAKDSRLPPGPLRQPPSGPPEAAVGAPAAVRPRPAPFSPALGAGTALCVRFREKTALGPAAALGDPACRGSSTSQVFPVGSALPPPPPFPVLGGGVSATTAPTQPPPVPQTLSLASAAAWGGPPWPLPSLGNGQPGPLGSRLKPPTWTLEAAASAPPGAAVGAPAAERPRPALFSPALLTGTASCVRFEKMHGVVSY